MKKKYISPRSKYANIRMLAPIAGSNDLYNNKLNRSGYSAVTLDLDEEYDEEFE